MTASRSLAAAVKDVDAVGPWTAVASAPSIDRDNEVVEARAFEPVPDSVVVRSAHFGGDIVGSARPYYIGDRLHIDGRFASTPRAQEVRTLVKEGHLQTMSVVFMPPTDRQVEGRRHIVTAELLAVDWAEIPSNRDARVLGVRSIGTPAGGASNMTAVRARIAAMQAELALLDLDAPMRPHRAELSRVYRDLAGFEAFLTDLNRTDTRR